MNSPFIDQEIPQLEAKHWFFTHLLNIRSTHTKFKGDSVVIALLDADADGLFSSNGRDAFAIADANTALDFREHISGVTLKDTTVFQWRDHNYLLRKVDSMGNYLEFVKTKLPFHGPVRLGIRFPNLPLRRLDDQVHVLDDIVANKKYTLLYLWGNWCKACHMGAEKLKEVAVQFDDRLQVIGVNSGEPKETVESYIYKYHHDWSQYYITGDFSREMPAVSYPMYILLDRKGNLLSYEAYPNLLGKLLE